LANKKRPVDAGAFSRAFFIGKMEPICALNVFVLYLLQYRSRARSAHTNFFEEEKMKKRIFLASLLASFLAAGSVSAQTGHGASHDGAIQEAGQGSAPQQVAVPMAPGMMMDGMMGPGMMHGKMGDHGGMSKCGSKCGPMHGGMMEPCMESLSPEAQQKFLDATKELRKKFNEKQFEYAELARNPTADKKELLAKRKELWEVKQKIHEKVWDFMTE